MFFHVGGNPFQDLNALTRIKGKIHQLILVKSKDSYSYANINQLFKFDNPQNKFCLAIKSDLYRKSIINKMREKTKSGFSFIEYPK